MVNKKNSINIIIFVLFALYIVLYRVLLYPSFMKYAETISAAFIVLMCFASFFIYGHRKYNNNHIAKKNIRSTLYSITFYFVVIYAIGLFSGFLNNAYSLKFTAIIDNIICPILIIVGTELFRYNFVKKHKNNKVYLSIITTLLFLFNINLYIGYNTFTSLDASFEFVTAILLPQIIQNILFTYSCIIGDYKSSMIYRLIMEIYVYIVPIQPDLNPLITSITAVVLPFSILLSIVNKNSFIDERKIAKKKLFRAADLPFILAAIALVCTIYGFGPYKMLGIETGSMAPNYNIGDAVIIDKEFDPEKLKVGDVIAYESVDSVLIIHRIIKINSDNSFITKGDSNNVADSFYVQRDKVVGCVKVRIPFIAYPALLFK